MGLHLESLIKPISYYMKNGPRFYLRGNIRFIVKIYVWLENVNSNGPLKVTLTEQVYAKNC